MILLIVSTSLGLTINNRYTYTNCWFLGKWKWDLKRIALAIACSTKASFQLLPSYINIASVPIVSIPSVPAFVIINTWTSLSLYLFLLASFYL